MKKLLKKIKLFALSALIFLASFVGVQSCAGVNVLSPKVATASAESVQQITDLTDTTWEIILNPQIDLNTDNLYDILFSDASGNNYIQFEIVYGEEPPPVEYLFYYREQTFQQVYAYFNGNWYNENYRTITITGGADVTNADLIAWLEDNATLISGGGPTIDDLTGTAWVLNEILILPPYGDYSIDFDPLLNAEIPTDGFYNNLYLNDDYGVTYSIESEVIPGYIVYEQTVYYIDDDGLFPFYGWGNQRNRLLVIYGGADATNATLIAWLEANGERIDDNDEFLLGYNYGYDNGYAYGYIRGREEGDEEGYRRGLREGQEAAGGIGQSIWDNMFAFFANIFDALKQLLSLEIVPSVNIALVTIGIPMAIWAIGAIIRLVLFFFGGA